jgi:hypothetical protein
MAGGDPRSSQAREVVARWMKLQSVYLKDDPELAVQAMLAQSEALQDPHLARKMPVDAELMAFVGEVAIKHDLSPVSLDLPKPRPVADDADRPTRAVVQRAVENLQKGEPKYDRMTPELAAIARPQTAMFQQVIRSLGALQTLDFEGASEIGDVYCLAFEEGALRCTIRLNAEGLIETIVWQGA